jgi:hypothetical protein
MVLLVLTAHEGALRVRWRIRDLRHDYYVTYCLFVKTARRGQPV